MHHTTLNIEKTVYNIMLDASIKYKIPVSYFVRELLKRSTCRKYLKNMNEILTEYQYGISSVQWKCFHIVFSECEVNKFYSARFLYRISVSKLLLIGFVLFFREIVRQLEKPETARRIYINSYSISFSFLAKNLKFSITKRFNLGKIIKDIPI